MHSGGINVLNAAGRIVQKYNNKQGPNSINSNNVTRLLLDAQNRMWIGTEESGINIYDFKTNKIEIFETLYPNKTLPGQGITYFFEDSKSNLWIGTGKGLCMLSSDGKIWRTFLKKDYQNQLQSDVIYCITEDKKGIIWIGTYFGLSYYDPVKNLFHTYTTADGLAGNKVVGIVPDKHNNLWFSTNNGLGFLDSTRNHFHSFTVDDGLPGAYFNYNSFFRDENGHLFFGGYKGLVEFNPDEIVTNNEPPKVILTGLYINGHAVTPKDSTEILINDIAETEKILLDYDQNIVTVDFAVMNFIKPNKNKSAYKLEGYNTDWQYTDTHSASFTNLAHGSYRLLIKASNNDGVWNTTPLTLKITVLPPPWKTWWAYGLYILAFLLALFGIIYFFASRAALRRKLRYEHMVNVKQQELHQMKMDFFTHISHELRTPLTLIIGPLEVLMNTPNGKPSNPKLLQTIKANAERLLKLTNDLLDFRKAEAGHTELKIKSGNLVDFTRCVYDKFTEAAAKKSIAYKFENTEETIEVYFDPHHLEIVLTNLLSNAIKFTSFGGTISVTVNKNGNETAEIKVYDNGIGIPKEKQAKIFSNFYQADAGGIKNTGSGIGLAFSKSLIELHQGKLNFHSGINQQTGMQETSFIVILQLGRKHFSSENLLNE
jgi:signal transduction histidine kinase